nr:MAG TPA: hypothetical protein [Caudoviricetes sp.]
MSAKICKIQKLCVSLQRYKFRERCIKALKI